VLETALNQELTEHLGHDKHCQPVAGNVRNGTRPKTVLTEGTGQVQLEVPRDREGTFEPQIVRKRQRRLSGVDEMVLSLYAKGLTTGEISAHFAEIYGTSVSKETISRITDKVIEEMTDWCNRPLDGVYAAIFVDAVMVKVRDGQVANRQIGRSRSVGERRARTWGSGLRRGRELGVQTLVEVGGCVDVDAHGVRHGVPRGVFGPGAGRLPVWGGRVLGWCRRAGRARSGRWRPGRGRAAAAAASARR
jgi:hypothetical protein